ncbi:L-glutamate gamma-semialdehyde dehydrogenase [Leeia sp. TBRC 13508]|uniref:L-glutamate gamma-semialdehyde dehydrogenase n=1 Tax=Leeia speluncae TaxID=2884804 RepID=A0ABS8DBG3_9NEIS|nr:L-glutamate gamma-semialdehyde dehydrogenase [Leeia speluncae]MCB6184968.1 L-glutamate gamma-semialdehyde dehydrogenase [Leeia speluncae]
MNSVPTIPYPKNDPELSFKEGLPQTVKLKEQLANTTVVDIPAVIGGVKYFSEDIIEVRPPHDQNRVIARIHRPNKEMIEKGIAACADASKEWANTSFADKAAIMNRAAEIIDKKKRIEIAAATMLGQSKTIDQADPDSGNELIDFLRFNAYNAQRVYADQPLTVPTALNRIDWRPLEGFVYAISPFNFTAIGANLTTAPAMMGNTVLWKPAEKASLANYIFYQALEEAGLPPGVINFMPGKASEVSAAALGSKDLAGIHFTGSSEVFQGLWKGVAENLSRFKSIPRIVGETGGKDFVLAHASADADVVAISLVRGAFEYQGQKCSAASRAYVSESLWPAVKEKMQAMLATLKVGDVADLSTFMGAVISKESHEKLTARIQSAKDDRECKIVYGGKTWKEPGFFVEPTVIEVSNPKHNLMEEELFGPVLTVYVFKDEAWDDVLQLVDSTSPYSLTGSIFCTDRYKLVQAEKALVNSAGNLYINDKPTGAMIGQQPFGGTRASGTNDKAGYWLNLMRWVSPRTVKESYFVDPNWVFGQ